MQHIVEFSEGGTPASEAAEACVDALIRARTRETPDATAIIAPDGTFSYRQLDGTSDRVAAALARHGVGRGDRVAIRMGRSARLITTWLAVLKLGAAYLPIAPGDPRERVEELLADARPALVACDHAPEEVAATTDVTLLEIDESVLGFAGDCPQRNADPSDLAYLMYTSGSTGKPKAVMVEHRSISNLVLDQDYVRIARNDIVLHRATPAFDAATFEIWGALLNGATLVVAPQDPIGVDDTAQLVSDHGVSIMFLTTAVFHQQVDERVDTFRNVRTAIAGGEALSPVHAERLQKAFPRCVVVNGYGPTEATTFTACHRVGQDEDLAASVPIGMPLRNVRVHLIDESGMPVADGSPGELCVSGAGLARGYWRRPRLTAERFIPNPFDEGEKPGSRLYRTGDLAQRLPGGELVFLGRLDDQFKLRGMRIEPEEIERVLTRSPEVRRAAVLVRRRAEGDNLTAFLVPREPSLGIDRRRLRRLASQCLPGHMVPAQFVMVDDIPVTGRGKIDREFLASILRAAG
ncbi:amino acid adenylation domain-containing protein [Streptomyces sp. NRRL F-5126]|uniref:amino acid adenylation domain-containing protein n=1 Tax=Streptomyces sp. NRRL F-5126 TaxID=1463857 RepID=UPI0006898A8B|nr:amino acid adenylation domain-containing protein [Streptomyces sp. NRRL F-5126]